MAIPPQVGGIQPAAPEPAQTPPPYSSGRIILMPLGQNYTDGPARPCKFNSDMGRLWPTHRWCSATGPTAVQWSPVCQQARRVELYEARMVRLEAAIHRREELRPGGLGFSKPELNPGFKKKVPSQINDAGPSQENASPLEIRFWGPPKIYPYLWR